eukprot:Sspe_Gene.36674::Locus_17719_Transcript_1_1_Confidence_1.000_Length_683::g.36674::m.36674
MSGPTPGWDHNGQRSSGGSPIMSGPTPGWDHHGQRVKREEPSTPTVRVVRVKLLVKGAKGLVNKGSRPGCEVKLRKVENNEILTSHPNPQKQAFPAPSGVQPGETSPEWNFASHFDVPITDVIRISIFGHKKLGIKDYLGRVDIFIPEVLGTLLQEKRIDRTLDVVGEEGRGEVSGTLDVALSLSE